MCVQYLGVMIGHVNAERAYAPALAKMKARVAFSKTLQLSLQEKVDIFKIWIQRVLLLPACVYHFMRCSKWRLGCQFGDRALLCWQSCRRKGVSTFFHWRCGYLSICTAIPNSAA